MESLTLKKANCKNCYKCIRHCPVKAIRFSGNQAYIIRRRMHHVRTVLCGMSAGRQGRYVSEVDKVRVLLQSGAAGGRQSGALLPC